MSDAKRFYPDTMYGGDADIWYGIMTESANGDYVLYAHYDALRGENARLSDQIVYTSGLIKGWAMRIRGGNLGAIVDEMMESSERLFPQTGESR